MLTELFVSPDGNDNWEGTRAKPLASLTAARDALRGVAKRRGPSPAGATVWMRGGDYVLDSPLELTAEDSGGTESPVVYRAAPGETVRLIGGRTIQGWRAVSDPAILKRLCADARTKVLQADLRAQGVKDLGGLASRGFSRPVTASHLELFFDDEPMTLAQWPNAGEFLKITGFTKPAKDEWNNQAGDLTGGFKYESNRPRSWVPSDDIWVHGYWSWDWANSYEHVRRLDAEHGIVETHPPHGVFNFRTGQRFYFLNVLEELDQPGEYYLDRKSGLIYFWPPAPMEGKRTLVSVMGKPLIRLDGASNLRLENLVVEGGRGCGIEITNCRQVTVGGCTIRNVGNWGVTVNGGARVTVTGCDVSGCGDGAIQVSGGDRKTLARADHAVTNNHLHHFGRWSRSYQAGILAEGVGLLLANNYIHDAPHNGILYSGNDIVIERNEICRVCLESGDVGAIYTGRDYTFRGNVIRQNFIHHLGGMGMGSSAIYMDDCVSGHLIVGNILWGGDGIWLGGGRDCIIENNVFVDCKASIAFDNRGQDDNPVWHNMVYQTMKSRLEDMNWRHPPYSTRWPELADLAKCFDGSEGVAARNNHVRRNIARGGWLNMADWPKKAPAQREWLGLENNLTDQDPCFVDANAGDFRLRPDSPAFKIGFEPIPVEKIGLQIDAYRASLPKRQTATSQQTRVKTSPTGPAQP